MTLSDRFATVLAETAHIASNSYLALLHEAVKTVDRASPSDRVTARYVEKLLDIVNRSNFALDGNHTNEFAQILGEAHFFLLCAERKVPLRRVRETRNKTPDFLHSANEIDVYFEVKTLSVVDGGRGINSDLERSLDAKIQIEKQLVAGKRIAVAVSEIQPYGDKPYHQGPISTVIDVLIEKTRQNIKRGQFSNPNTFLVVNLCMIPPFRTDNRVLRPAYSDDHMFSKAVTGNLWMMAFAQPGMLVHGCPRVEGKPCVEGVINKTGILADPGCNDISGLLFMVHPWGRNPEIWGLFRSENLVQWRQNEPNLIPAMFALTGTNWNDDKDSNGWRLQGENE
jgi:hypothetical protein